MSVRGSKATPWWPVDTPPASQAGRDPVPAPAQPFLRGRATQVGPKPAEESVAAFEVEHDIVLPDAYRQFVTHIGGSGAEPFYGLMPLERCSLTVMNPRGEPGAPRRFEGAALGYRPSSYGPEDPTLRNSSTES